MLPRRCHAVLRLSRLINIILVVAADMASPSDEKSRRVLGDALHLWKKPTLSERAPVPPSGPADILKLRKDLTHCVSQTDQLSRHIATLERRWNKHEESLRAQEEQHGRHDADFLHLRGEVSVLLKEFEHISLQLERERGKISELHEHVDFLRLRTSLPAEVNIVSPSVATYWALASWVFVPLVHLIRGLWVLLFPIVATFQPMFGDTSVLGDSEDVDLGMDVSTVSASAGPLTGSADIFTADSLLEMLNSGTLDPSLE